jgi:hypothetical protein
MRKFGTRPAADNGPTHHLHPRRPGPAAVKRGGDEELNISDPQPTNTVITVHQLQSCVKANVMTANRVTAFFPERGTRD